MSDMSDSRVARAVLCGCLVLAVAGGPACLGQAAAAVPTEQAQAAVGLVTKSYTVNPLAKADAKGKPLPKTGTWGVRAAVAEERVAACNLEGASCDVVVYRAGQPEVLCSWTVLFRGGDAAPQIVSDNDGSAGYMLRFFKNDDKDRPPVQKRYAAEDAPIAKLAHASGRVVLDLNVDKSGKIVEVTVTGSTNSMFINNAMVAAKKWIMTPYTLNGKPRPYEQEVVFDFAGW